MTRLVERGPHSVDVYPRIEEETDLGPVRKEGPVQHVSMVRVSARTADVVADTDGARFPTTLFRIVGAGAWPGNDGARVVVTEGPYPGKSLFQIGETVYRASNARTAHYVVTCRGREG